MENLFIWREKALVLPISGANYKLGRRLSIILRLYCWVALPIRSAVNQKKIKNYNHDERVGQYEASNSSGKEFSRVSFIFLEVKKPQFHGEINFISARIRGEPE